MTNEEVFQAIREMFASGNHNTTMRIGKNLKDHNVMIKDLNTKLVIYNNNQRIVVPTVGKGSRRKYLFDKFKSENL